MHLISFGDVVIGTVVAARRRLMPHEFALSTQVGARRAKRVAGKRYPSDVYVAASRPLVISQIEHCDGHAMPLSHADPSRGIHSRHDAAERRVGLRSISDHDFAR